MAVNFKIINDKLEKSPLSIEELDAIAEVEQFIDALILNKFNGNEISVNLNIAKFNRTTKDMSTSWPAVRRKLMYKELIKRYNDASWEASEAIGDSREMCSQDFLVLKGIK